jgi:hypothetical protein
MEQMVKEGKLILAGPYSRMIKRIVGYSFLIMLQMNQRHIVCYKPILP